MSEWNIVLSPEFKQETRNIYSYIAKTLLAPETALKQIRRILNAVKSLDDMPSRHSLYEKEPWHSRGVRKYFADKYVILYIVNDEKREVAIHHVCYGGRDIDKILE